MVKETKENCNCAPGGCCNVEAVISVDERGQMVLPKDVREKADIHAGDKLAVVIMKGENEKTCCLSLVKIEEFSNMVKDMLGPMMGEILKK
jgi:antitoxin PrlF